MSWFTDLFHRKPTPQPQAAAPDYDPSTPPDLTHDPHRNEQPKPVQDLTDLMATGAATRAGHWDGNTRIVTYSFAPTEFTPDGRAKNYGAFSSKEEQEAALAAMAEIEKTSNIKFVRVDDPKKADLTFAEGDANEAHPDGKTWDGMAPMTGDHRQITIRRHLGERGFDKNHWGYHVVTHEILHALGLDHPGGAGNNPNYNTRDTGLSYNESGEPQNFGLAPDDIAALQYAYGKPRNQPANIAVNPDELPKDTTIYAPGTATIKVPEGSKGFIAVDLFKGEVRSGLVSPTGNPSSVSSNPTIAHGTNVTVDVGNSDVSLELSGRAGAKLTGGKNDNILIASGGNNVMTGGGGHNTFVISAQSQNGNIITNFDPSKDKLLITRQSEIHYVQVGNDVRVELFRDSDHKSQTSVTVKNMTIDKLQKAVATGEWENQEKSEWRTAMVNQAEDQRSMADWIKEAKKEVARQNAPADLTKPLNFSLHLPNEPRETDKANSAIIDSYRAQMNLPSLHTMTYDGAYMSGITSHQDPEKRKELETAVEKYVRAEAAYEVAHGAPPPSLKEMRQRYDAELGRAYNETMLAYKRETSHDSTDQPVASWLQERIDIYNQKTASANPKALTPGEQRDKDLNAKWQKSESDKESASASPEPESVKQNEHLNIELSDHVMKDALHAGRAVVNAGKQPKDAKHSDPVQVTAEHTDAIRLSASTLKDAAKTNPAKYI